ncbi:ribokinase [Actinomadura graeca]|uniref:Ribokinase n=1 Tax=Actinomadura graeca TaxID=2750812 RepID=A0ABX8QSZ0_9ACTN|nr:ribokinase [Actinomadura graeca]QXJ21857.1 ribokinase [Actinomadura graeca]
MSGPVRLLVVGSLNMDLTVTVPRLPECGETVLGGDAARTPGGKGANQAVAARRLGAEVRMVGLVGDDVFGDQLREAIAAEGVDVAGVETAADAATGLAMIMVRSDGENAIAVAPGANAALGPDTARDAAGGGAEKALLLQLEIPVDACEAAAAEARRRGMLVVLNAAPSPRAVDARMARLLRLVDLLIVNEGEAAALYQALRRSPGSGAPGHDGVHDGLHDGVHAGVQDGVQAPGRDGAAVAEALRSLGPDRVVVTLGADGAAGAGPDGTFRVAAFPVTAVDAVGAGDAFCAALAIAVADGTSLPAAARRACAAGALAVTRRGAQGSLPRAADVDALLAGEPAGRR